jgi:UDP-2,3-diacylglucosamine pyrophosphatase LpxH/uncharacterized membrane protein HdeD (DUF308 family)
MPPSEPESAPELLPEPLLEPLVEPLLDPELLLPLLEPELPLDPLLEPEPLLLLDASPVVPSLPPSSPPETLLLEPEHPTAIASASASPTIAVSRCLMVGPPMGPAAAVTRNRHCLGAPRSPALGSGSHASCQRHGHIDCSLSWHTPMDRSGRDIFVISDLHLGDGGLRDKFEPGNKTRHLRAFLDHVGAEGGELFILGDLFELWQMNLSSLLVKRRELLDHFASLDVAYIPGNHDVDLAHFEGTDFIHHPFFQRMRKPFIREVGGKRYAFSHGHETDPFNAGDDPGFGRMLAIFAALFEQQKGSPLLTGGEGVGDVLEQFGESMLTIWRVAAAAVARRAAGSTNREAGPNSALTPAQDPDRLLEHVAGVRAALERGAYDVTVLGHTHKPGRIGGWYFNSGTWVGSRSPYLRISADGDIRYHEWKDDRPVECEMPVVLEEGEPARETRRSTNPFRGALSAGRKLFPKPIRPQRARWVLIVQGALALALGIGALAVSIGKGSSAGWRLLVTAFGAYALLDGVISLLGPSRMQPVKRLLSRVRGAASILLGLVVLRHGYAVQMFAVLVGLSAFFAGALQVAASVVFKRMVDSRWLLLVGAGTALTGLVLLLLPTSAVLLKFILAGYLSYYGTGQLLAGVFGQRLPSSSTGPPCARLPLPTRSRNA